MPETRTAAVWACETACVSGMLDRDRVALQSTDAERARRLLMLEFGSRSEFDDFRCNLFLSHVLLCCVQLGKLAFDLSACRCHRFHACFVLGGESMQRGVAKLCMQVVRDKIAEQAGARVVVLPLT